MADNGKPYKTCTHELCSRMGELAAIADIITPNITEAAILLRENPVQPDTAMQKIKSYLVRLSELGPKIVVITSVFSEKLTMLGTTANTASSGVSHTI